MFLAHAAVATALVVSACSPTGPTATAATGTSPVTTANIGGMPFASTGGGMGSRGTVANANASGMAQFAPTYGSNQQYGIWVSGTGRVTAKPDTGILSFGVESRGAKVAGARDEAAKTMTAALKVLKDHQVADKDIQTQQYSIYPIIVYTDSKAGPSTPQITGYTVSNQATAKIRALDTFGDVIDAMALAAGNNIRINSVGFTIDDPKPLEAQARQLALQDAMTKGKQIAQVTGVSLGAPLFISEGGGSPMVPEKAYAARAYAGAPAAVVSTPINPGDSEVFMHVQMVFAIP